MFALFWFAFCFQVFTIEAGASTGVGRLLALRWSPGRSLAIAFKVPQTLPGVTTEPRARSPPEHGRYDPSRDTPFLGPPPPSVFAGANLCIGMLQLCFERLPQPSASLYWLPVALYLPAACWKLSATDKPFYLRLCCGRMTFLLVVSVESQEGGRATGLNQTSLDIIFHFCMRCHSR